MSFKFDQFNVFKIPHSRMMQLVNSCNKTLDLTDFANNDALITLLSNLSKVFKEFKSHEDIENEHIMTKLRSKLKAMAIYNSAVCNCHKDDEFTPLLNLFEAGYLYLNKSKSTSEKISYGIKLRKALTQFTKKFIPHMKEEEEVFQPLLMEHFSQEELTEMKNVVIKLHMQQRKRTLPFDKTAENFKTKIPTRIDQTEDSFTQDFINQLPNELVLKIFSYLKINENLKCAQVCKKWNRLVYDEMNWKSLVFSDWQSNKDHEIDKNSFDYEDMESIDYSDDENDYENKIFANLRDVKTLKYWIKYLLPNVGAYIKHLDLNNCISLNNNLARKILQLCPNLKSLNISYTKIGDNSFRGVLLDKLEYLNCEGCEYLTDNAFKYLLLSTTNLNIYKSKICIKNPMEDCKIQQVELDLCKDCVLKNNIEELDKLDNHDKNESNSNEINSLKSINLSGCWSISDYGLSYIASKYDLSKLQYLNLSGCINLTAFGMNLFLEFSNLLKGENLYYCDNIEDGPLKESANGCENVECGKKFCCRQGNIF